MAANLIWYSPEAFVDICLDHGIAPTQRFVDNVERHIDDVGFSVSSDHTGALIERLDIRYRRNFYDILGKLELIDPIAFQISVSAQALHQAHARLRARLKPFV